MKFLAHFTFLVSHFLKLEFSAKERIVTPLLFGAVVLLLFAFSFPEPPEDLKIKMLVGQSLISSFFAIQIALSRAFEFEAQDRVFDQLRVSKIDGNAFIAAKIFHLLVMGAATLLFTVILAATMQSFSPGHLWSFITLGMGALTLTGLACLGVLLSAITIRSQAKQVLFPILYFPLCTPVLIAGNEFLCQFLAKGIFDDTCRSWFIILAAFDAIYLTLAILMGSETVSSSS